MVSDLLKLLELILRMKISFARYVLGSVRARLGMQAD